MANDKNINQTLAQDPDYEAWVNNLSSRYMQSQVRAAVGINTEQLKYYWSVGRDIISMNVEERWGQGVIKQLSHDLTNRLDRKGFSVTSLGYMKRFYLLYPESIYNLPPAGGKKNIDSEESHNKTTEIMVDNLPPAEGKIENAIFLIPWSHHKAILDKVEGNRQKALFFVRKSIENQWGRAMLENMLDSDLYEVQGEAANNFTLTLPKPEADLARDLFKGTYQLGFTQISQQYNEAQLKAQLVNHIQEFLLELGRGFSFVGREYHIRAAGKEKYIDLLFYIIPLHRYCVVEVKITELDFPDIGQLAGYMGMVDDILNTNGDNPCIGLLICRSKNNIFAQYALNRINAPIGIADYKLFPQLPTPEEIQHALIR